VVENNYAQIFDLVTQIILRYACRIAFGSSIFTTESLYQKETNSENKLARRDTGHHKKQMPHGANRRGIFVSCGGSKSTSQGIRQLDRLAA
jgi:hypothetical protein